jgi:hypothetical protein
VVSPYTLLSFQSLTLVANTPVQITAIGNYNLAILNTGPGNLYISTGATPGPNVTSIIVPVGQYAPPTPTSARLWLSSDQAGGVSIAQIPRQGFYARK